VSWPQLYGAALLCGIGFTMSLFIGSLAFASAAGGPLLDERLGVILGSLFAGAAGFVVLHASLPRHASDSAP
jgi:NhaA family Na+:H+ antiporter